MQYGFNGQSYSYTIPGPSFPGNAVDLELTRQGGLFTAAYSIDGTTFNTLWQVAGLTGTSQLDLTEYGAVPGLTASFSNLNVSAVPLPPALPMFGAAITGVVALAAKRRRGVTRA